MTRKTDVRPDFVPKDAYISKDFLRLEAERLWPKVWLIACREEEIPRAGDFVTFDIADQSIIVVRQADGGVGAFHNVCQHRGRRLKDGCGNTGRSIFCRFHGWRWKIDGSLEKVVNSEDWSGCSAFSDEDLRLKSVRVDTWGGAVWVCMNAEIEPLRDYLAPLPEMMEPFDLEKMRFAWYKTVTLPCNWKVATDAFNEAYHSQATHAQQLKYGIRKSGARAFGRHGMFYFPAGGARDTSAATEPEPEAGISMGADSPFARRFSSMDPKELLFRATEETRRTLQALISAHGLKAAQRLRDDPEEIPADQLRARFSRYYREEMAAAGIVLPDGLTDQAVTDAGQDWHIFPNTIILPALDGVLWYRMRPNGENPDSCIFDVWCLERHAPGQEPAVEHQIFDGPEAFKGQNPFLEQDIGNMAAVQTGMRSLGFSGSRTNPIQEAVISNFHKVLREYVLPND
jgi:phenylpropionate dioxygenase-like ring-hydroxylating dioxygenase large terminal subunit